MYFALVVSVSWLLHISHGTLRRTSKKHYTLRGTGAEANAREKYLLARGLEATGGIPDFYGSGDAQNQLEFTWSRPDLVAKGQGGREYGNQYGNPSATLEQFSNNYKGKTENQIVFGQSSFLGYNFPNDINKKFRFVSIGNGREVDMIHFMVVGRRGYLLGYANEIKQALSFSSSAFYPHDLYSNKLGINFFDRYGPSIQQNPTKISEYINWYLSNPENW